MRCAAVDTPPPPPPPPTPATYPPATKPEKILQPPTVDVHEGLKVADFGSCRGIYSKQPYTEYISTRWYRAPECLLTDGYYGAEMDIWGVACVIFEISALFPLFPGVDERDQIKRIHAVLGTP